MIRHEIELDDDTDRILADIAGDYPGGINEAVAELVRSHAGIEDLVEQCEEAHADSLQQQRDRAERGFREGRFTMWDEVKRRNGL